MATTNDLYNSVVPTEIGLLTNVQHFVSTSKIKQDPTTPSISQSDVEWYRKKAQHAPNARVE
jgi:hypothetical protein